LWQNVVKSAGKNVVTAWCLGGEEVVPGSVFFALLKKYHFLEFIFVFVTFLELDLFLLLLELNPVLSFLS
jgi:hypothetical protein